MRRGTPSGRIDPPPSGGLAPRRPSLGIFRKDGEYWTVGWEGRVFRLKDTKGFAYLAHLLRHPATEFHALDLVGGIAHHREDDESTRPDAELEAAGIHVATSDDAGEMLDEQAKATYRRRLAELREELDAAKAHGRVGRAEAAEREIAILTSELSRAVGLLGRDRRAASASERARQSVTKTIRAVIERIAQNDAALGEVLSRYRTGAFCAYEQDTDAPIAWEFGLPEAEPGSAVMPSQDAGTAPRDARPAVLGVSLFSLAERTRFVGREPERATIRGAVARALEGEGSLVMLAGGPGVGKTRLAMEMADEAARRGFRVLVGHCDERDEPFPYLPFAEIIESGLTQAASLDDYRKAIGDSAAELAQIAPRLRRVFPDLPEPRELPPQQRRRHLFQSFSEALARTARRRPQFHVVDDLHWADESTLSLGRPPARCSARRESTTHASVCRVIAS